MSSSYMLLRQSLLRHSKLTRSRQSLQTSSAVDVSLFSVREYSSFDHENERDHEYNKYHQFSRTRDERLTALNYAAATKEHEKDGLDWMQFMQLKLQHQLQLQQGTGTGAGSWIHWAKQNFPKGFSDFFPESGKSKPPLPGAKPAADTPRPTSTQDSDAADSSNDDADTTDTAKLASQDDKSSNDKKNSKKDQKHQGSGAPEDDNVNLPGLLALLALVVTVRSYMEQEERDLGKEITFVEFRNSFLFSGNVEKLEIVNKRMARVILKPNATMAGLAAATAGSGSADAANFAESQQDGTTMRFEETSLTVPSSSETAAERAARGQRQQHFYFNVGSVESLEEKLTKAQQDKDIHPSEWIEVQYVEKTNWTVEALKTLPFIAFVAAVYFGSRGMAGMPGGASGGKGGMGGIFGVGKSTAKKISPDEVNVSFKDVAGCQQAKMEIMEFVDFLKNSERFTKLGAKIPKGALLCGPPGTGKTLLARAVAGEAGVPFYSISGSDFIEMFVGVGPSRVRDLFKEARANAPCIIFIDEIDAVGRQRGRGGFSGGNDERENTLNQLLVEMDGFSPSTGVVVLAGTNRVDILDQALTRPGRFDRQITVDRPDLQGRKEIFEVHLQGLTLAEALEEYSGRLAGLTPGFAGADIANICNEAAIVAARRKGESVSMNDFEKATDRIIGGLESNKIMSKEEQSIVAHHEAGHAVAGWFLEHADPLLKVTIIPRASGALGFAQYLPKEVFLRSEAQIRDIVCMALAGRAAEEVFFGGVTTGASDDLRRVTQLVYSTIQVYGMNEKVGQLAFPKSEGGGPGDKPYSDSTAEAMDDEARRIVDTAYESTVNLIRKHKQDVENVAKLLLERETITHDDMVDLIGPRPFEADSAYTEYVSSRKPAEAKEEAVKEEEEVQVDGNGLTPGLV
jgi:AFG3 family protein